MSKQNVPRSYHFKNLETKSKKKDKVLELALKRTFSKLREGNLINAKHFENVNCKLIGDDTLEEVVDGVEHRTKVDGIAHHHLNRPFTVTINSPQDQINSNHKINVENESELQGSINSFSDFADADTVSSYKQTLKDLVEAKRR